MLAIKLQRIGKKHQPSYRLVVAERRSKMAAPPVEDLGAYSVSTKKAAFNKERILHWIKMGAQPTLSVHNLLVEQGTITTKKLAVKMKKKAVAAEGSKTEKTAAPVTAQAEVIQESQASGEVAVAETPAA
jgi:small subunit ribosomal protein S16